MQVTRRARALAGRHTARGAHGLDPGPRRRGTHRGESICEHGVYGAGGMRVAVDARALAGGRGVTRYLRELLTALARAHPDDEWHLFLPGRGAVLLEFPRNVVVHRHVLPGRVLFGAAAVSGRPRIDRLVGVAPDVVWAPTIAPMALSAGVPLVLTIQDLSFELRPGDFTSYERLLAPRGPAASPGAAGGASDRAGAADARAARGPLGVGRKPDRGGGARGLGAPGPARPAAATPLIAPHYLLAVGALEPRKAPDLLVRAFGAARADGSAGPPRVRRRGAAGRRAWRRRRHRAGPGERRGARRALPRRARPGDALAAGGLWAAGGRGAGPRDARR